MVLVEPHLFVTEEATIDIEEVGELTRGATIIDHRPTARQRKNVEVITSVDIASVRESIIRGLKFAGQQSE